MHSSSPTIGVIAAALAKAQLALSNPEKTLAAIIQTRGGEQSFRYASLAAGLDLVRKSLGEHEIAMMQTTTLDRGQILLTTLLVHSSGEWVSSIWPVCSAGETSARFKGAALTYARRYALFAIVGIAGEDDLDAPDLERQPEQIKQHPQVQPRTHGRSNYVPRSSCLPPDQSAQLRDRLLQEIAVTEGEDNLALWAHLSLPLKNTLRDEDSKALEAAYLAKIAVYTEQQPTKDENNGQADRGFAQTGELFAKAG